MGLFGIMFFSLLACSVIYQIVANDPNSYEYKVKYGWDNEKSTKAASDIRNLVIFFLVIFVIICIILFGMLLSILG